LTPSRFKEYFWEDFPGDNGYPRLLSLGYMYEFGAAYFVQIVWVLTQMEQDCKKYTGSVSEDNLKFLHDHLSGIIENCEKIGGLPTSIIGAQDMRDWLNKMPRQYVEAGQRVGELRNRIRDELRVKTCLVLSDREADHYINFRKDWEKIIERFPGALSDIEEARKCFALIRYPAAVFHSTQIVEVGLIELGRFLKVTDPKSGWTAVTHALSNFIKKDHKSRTRFEKKNFQFLEQIHGTVEALKDAWRNKVGHVQGRLVLLSSEFTPAITEEILLAVRGFMRRLSEGLPAVKMPPRKLKTLEDYRKGW
jgi:HEPN domain-containing protein